MFSVSCNANASFRMLPGPENILFLGHPNNWRVEGRQGILCTSWEPHGITTLVHGPARKGGLRKKSVVSWELEWVRSTAMQWCAVIIDRKGNGQAIVLLDDMRCEMQLSFSRRVYLITKHCHVPRCSEALSQVSHHLISSSTTFTWRWIVVGKLRQMIEAFQK